MDKPDELIELTVAVNLLAHFWTMKAFLPDMLARSSGHIVNMASAGGILGVPYISDYCASKFGAIGLTESIRQELKLLGFKKIKVSYVCPNLSLIHISEPTRLGMISYAVFCLKKKK